MAKAHFIGICGAGMSAVAKLLKDSGWEVSGSDEGFYPPTSDYLMAEHIPCATPYAASNIPEDAAIIVIGKHARLVPEENEEVAAAFNLSGARVVSFPEVLKQLSTGQENYVIVGSFGKSTCSSLVAWVLSYTKKDPSYFIGAMALNFEGYSHLGTGGIFVMEGDEYPSANWDEIAKFMYYNAKHVLLTSAEHDHVNVFPTIEDYLKPFQKLVTTIPQDGTLVACLDGQHVDEILDFATVAPITYSLREKKADWYAEDIRHEGKDSYFNLMHKGKLVATICTGLLGEHNIQNMVGVSALLLATQAVTPDELTAALAEFKGVRRRLELRTNENAPVALYEDFGSSRAKALAGITAVREQFPEYRLTVVFEPHTFSFRNREAIGWYDDLFAKADRVFVFDPPMHGSATHEQLSQEEIVARIAASGTWVLPFNSKEELQAELEKDLRLGSEIILVETSGAIGGVIPFLTDWLNTL